MDRFDVAIIGAGVYGAAIDRRLSQHEISVFVLEKEPDVSFGTSKANSEIIQGGFHHEEIIRGRAVALTTGSRERNRGSLRIPGSRPSGILTSGEAQRMVNIDGITPGNRAIIIGSGDIGLIMALRNDPNQISGRRDRSRGSEARGRNCMIKENQRLVHIGTDSNHLTCIVCPIGCELRIATGVPIESISNCLIEMYAYKIYAPVAAGTPLAQKTSLSPALT